MPDFSMADDQGFSTLQVIVPPILPSILKKYAKAAIRTQPYDLLVWSAAYFRALAFNQQPPVKPRLEFPPVEPFGLSKGYIKLLVSQLGKTGNVPIHEMQEKWTDVCLPIDKLNNILKLGQFYHAVDLPKFVAIALGFLENTLRDTMIQVCEILTDEPDGGSAMLDAYLFIKLYRFLAEMDCGEDVKEENSDPSEDKSESSILIIKPSEGPTLQDKPQEEDGWNKTVCAINVDLSQATVSTLDENKNITFDLESKPINCKDEQSESDKESVCAVEVFEKLDLDGTSLLHEENFPVANPVKEEENKDIKDILSEDNLDVEEVDKQITEVDKQITVPSIKDMTLSMDGSTMLDFEEAMHEILNTDESKEEIDRNERCTPKKIIERNLHLPINQEKINDKSDITIFKQDGLYSREESTSDETRSSDSYELVDEKAVSNETSIGMPLKETVSLREMRITFNKDARQKKLSERMTLDRDRLMTNEIKTDAINIPIERLKHEFKMRVEGIGPKLPEDMIQKVEDYILCCAREQAGVVMPRNLRHFMCPPMFIDDRKWVLKAQIDDLLEGPIPTDVDLTRDMKSPAPSEISLTRVHYIDEPSGPNSEVSLSLMSKERVLEELVAHTTSIYDLSLTVDTNQFVHVIDTGLSFSIARKDQKYKKDSRITLESYPSSTAPEIPQEWYMLLSKEVMSKDLISKDGNISYQSKQGEVSQVNSDVLSSEGMSVGEISVGGHLETRLAVDNVHLQVDENTYKKKILH